MSLDSTNQPLAVFLSHNSKDKPAVERLAIRLTDEADLKVWFDKWNLKHSEPFLEQLEEGINQASALVVFIGPSGLSPWHSEEMRVALQRRVEEPGFRVVLALLPNATRHKLPRFLARFPWIEFRTEDDAEAFRRLVAGIRGVAPGRSEGDAEYPDSGFFDEGGKGLSQTPHQSTRAHWAIWLAVVLFVVSLASLYQRAKTERAPEPIPAMQVIVDNAQGQPAVGALVEIDALPGQTFITNSDGAVSIANIPRHLGDKIRIKASNGKTTADVYLPFPNPNSERIVLR